MIDRFKHYTVAWMAPATDAVAVTPDNDNDLSELPRALWIGGAGNISLVTRDGTTVTFSGIQTGTLLPIRAKRVRSSDTTATLILALY